MKKIYNFLFLALIISSVTNAQEVTMDFLRSSTWTFDGIDYQYAFTDDSLYRGTKLASYGVSAEPYYLSSEPHHKFRDELVGKNMKGNYVIRKDEETGDAYNHKIISVSDKGIILYDTRGGYVPEWFVRKNDSEKYDTLRLSCSYKELTYKHGKKYQQAFFDAFPSIWYDFERTFNGAFFKHDNIKPIYKQDFSHDFEKYLDAFNHLSAVNATDYYRKLIDVTIGMPLHSTPASDMWQEIVVAKVAANEKLVSQLLKEKSGLQQARFWQFVQKDNEYLKSGVATHGKQSCIKEIWRVPISYIDKERIYFTDSLCYIVKNCVPLKTPEIVTISPYRMDEDGGDVGGAIVFTRFQEGKHTKLRMLLPGDDGTCPTYYRRAPSLVTDTLFMAATYRDMVIKKFPQELVQRPFFDTFPSTWSDFYAVMVSDEYGNKGFHRHAPEYIAAFEQLDCIPIPELLRKMVGISIGAISQDPVSEQWRTTVKSISSKNKDELRRVLLEFEPWQRASFREFVENKAENQLRKQ